MRLMSQLSSVPVFALVLVNLSGVVLTKFGIPVTCSRAATLLALLVLLAHARMLLTSAKDNAAGWLAVALVFASMLWSLAPAATFDVARRIALAFAFGIVLARRLEPAAWLRLLSVLFAGIVIASWVGGLLFPEWGRDPAPKFRHIWIGAYGDSNILALYMGMALATFLAFWHVDVRRWVRVGLVLLTALALWTLVASGSATGLVCVGVLAAEMLLPLVKKIHVPLLLLAVAVAGYGVWTHQTQTLNLLGKSVTLTGRTVLWERFMEVAQERPLLGYGGQNLYIHIGGTLATPEYYSKTDTAYPFFSRSLYRETDLFMLARAGTLLSGRPLRVLPLLLRAGLNPLVGYGGQTLYAYAGRFVSGYDFPAEHRFMNETVMLTLLRDDMPMKGFISFWQQFLTIRYNQPFLGPAGQRVSVYIGSVAPLPAFYNFYTALAYTLLPHSLYVTLLLKYGYVGSALFLVFFTTLGIRALRADSRWPVLMLTVIALFGLTLTIDDLAMIWLCFGLMLSAQRKNV